MSTGNPVFGGRLLRSSPIRARTVFLSAMAMLCLCAIATYLSFSYFKESEAEVVHTHEVRGAVGDLEAALSNAARATMSYVISGDDSDLTAYRTVVARVPEQMGRLRELTKDNSVQVDLCKRLESLTAARIQTWEASIVEKQLGKPADVARLMRQNMDFASRSAGLTEPIRTEETHLLNSRTRLARQGFVLASSIVLSSFVLALIMLYVHYRLLNTQLRAREKAEQAAREACAREAGLRQEEVALSDFIGAVKDYAIFTLDSNGYVGSWNEGAQRLKGYAASEILGKHFSCFYPEEDIQAGRPKLELEIATRDGRIEDEGWRVRKDGSRFWANVVITATRDQSGQLIGFTKVTRDFTERMRAQEELKQANTELTAEVAERKSAENRLAASEESLRGLSLHLLRTQDEERRRIGRDLHDSLGQYLAMLKMNLDSLQSTLGLGSNGASQEIEKCIHLAEDSLKEVRTISYLLYPPMLEEMGLKSAIPWYLDGFSKRSNIQVGFQVDSAFRRLAPEVELALFRVLQESLTNVHRHSGSPTANIQISVLNGNVVLEIKDKGKGIPSNLLEQAEQDWMGSLGVGLRGMNERLRQLGGKLEVSSTAHGTTVKASVPAIEHSADSL